MNYLSQEDISFILYILIIVLIYFCIFVVMIILILAILGYIMFIYFKKKIFNYQIKGYNKKTQSIMNKFGGNNIHRIFLMNTPVNSFYVYGIYLFYQIDISYLFHPSLILELELDKNARKWIRIEKNEGIYLSEDYYILKSDQLIPLKKLREKITLLELLETSKQNMGEPNFFNWHILQNNCQDFIEELLKTMNVLTPRVKKQLSQKNSVNINEHNFMYFFLEFVAQCFSFSNYF